MESTLIKEITLAGQEHLILHYNRLVENKDEKAGHLLEQIKSLDFQQINKDYKRATEDKITKEDQIEPLPKEDFCDVDIDPEQRKKWETIGMKHIKDGKVAVLLMAGGQGTRLGSPSPKGVFNIQLPSQKTLLQIQAERILRLQQLAGNDVVIPWYIMASEHTDIETLAFFEKHNYFGLKKENVIFFRQGEFPCLSLEGKILMSSPSEIALAPNGNGGLYSALKKEGILDDMMKRKIEYVHVYGVDNILVRLGDPVFIGFCTERNSKCGAKAVPKSRPDEAVGVFALRNNTYQVIEYSEIDEERSRQTDENGVLLYNAGNIANHFFTVEFLKDIADNHLDHLEFHVAKKKISYIADDGNQVIPDKPNAIKLEMFVFDVFRFSQELAVLLVHRDLEFSPLKNASGAKDCTPEICRNDLLALHRRFIEEAKGKLLPDENGNYEVEISPLVTYAGEGLEKVAGREFQTPLQINSL